ncbi:MAG: hypothetical protein BGO67_00150 [Alphaproteobacteria bacterium 41-28]|nr:MAG: hypothetical protein BGO67_00150 [Alphaproteobacteria bacterium 41-28]
MKKTLCLLLATGFTFNSEAFAVINITNAWVQATQQGGSTALSMSVQNTADTPDNLISVQTDISERIMLRAKDASGHMTPFSSIPIPANGSINFGPTATHIYLIRLKKPLTPGNTSPLNAALANGHAVKFVLSFQYAGQVTLNAPVKAH